MASYLEIRDRYQDNDTPGSLLIFESHDALVQWVNGARDLLYENDYVHAEMLDYTDPSDFLSAFSMYVDELESEEGDDEEE